MYYLNSYLVSETPVVRLRGFDLLVDNASDVAKQYLNEVQVEPGGTFSADGGNTTITRSGINFPAYPYMVDGINICLRALDPGYRFTTRSIITTWGNILTKNCKNKIHDHRGAQWVAIYYAQIGKIERGEVGGVLNLGEIVLEPKVGGLVMFSGDLPHLVTPYNSSTPRVSVVSNLRSSSNES